MSSYCIKEKKITEDVNPKYVLTKKWENDEKINLCIMSNNKDQIRQKRGGAVDIYKAMLPLLSKKGFTLPGYKYCGPGNPLDLGKPKLMNLMKFA